MERFTDLVAVDYSVAGRIAFQTGSGTGSDTIHLGDSFTIHGDSAAISTDVSFTTPYAGRAQVVA